MESQRLTFCSSHYSLTDLDDWFNITATFKKDSTLYVDYKEFRSWTDIELNSNYLHSYQMLLKNNVDPMKSIIDLSIKNKNLARAIVFISHCETNSRRETYINELLNFMDIDIYGSCGNYFPSKNVKKTSCGPFKSLNNSKCMNSLLSQYKFYLSFENSNFFDFYAAHFCFFSVFVVFVFKL
jgi:alpha-1,3-fucosyltransferase